MELANWDVDFFALWFLVLRVLGTTQSWCVNCDDEIQFTNPKAFMNTFGQRSTVVVKVSVVDSGEYLVVVGPDNRLKLGRGYLLIVILQKVMPQGPITPLSRNGE